MKKERPQRELTFLGKALSAFVIEPIGPSRDVPKEMKAGNVSGAVILVGRRTESGYETWQKAYGLKQTEPEPVVRRDDGDSPASVSPSGRPSGISSSFPQPSRRDDAPINNKKLKRLKQVVEERARSLSVAPELLTKRRHLEKLIRSEDEQGRYHLPGELGGWREAAVGEALLAELLKPSS